MMEVTKKREEAQQGMKYGPLTCFCKACVCAGFFYVGFTVEPLNSCHEPWQMWYQVAGAIELAELVLTISIMRSSLKMLESDSMMKANVYQEQHREEEAVAAANE